VSFLQLHPLQLAACAFTAGVQVYRGARACVSVRLLSRKAIGSKRSATSAPHSASSAGQSKCCPAGAGKSSPKGGPAEAAAGRVMSTSSTACPAMSATVVRRV